MNLMPKWCNIHCMLFEIWDLTHTASKSMSTQLMQLLVWMWAQRLCLSDRECVCRVLAVRVCTITLACKSVRSWRRWYRQLSRNSILAYTSCLQTRALRFRLSTLLRFTLKRNTMWQSWRKMAALMMTCLASTDPKPLNRSFIWWLSY